MNRSVRGIIPTLSQVSIGIAALFVLGLALPQKVYADIIYSNFGVNDSYDLLNAEQVSGSTSAFGSQQDIAVSFIPSADYLLTSVALPVSLTSGTDGLVFSLTDDDGGQPAATALIRETQAINSGFAVTTWIPQTNLTLLKDQTYWFTASTEQSDGQYDWALNVLEPKAQGVARQIDTSGWVYELNKTTPTLRVAGNLAVSTPEPTTLPLLLLGFSLTAGLFVFRKKRRALALLCLFGISPVQAQVNVLTQHNDNFRTGGNTKETVLNQSNVTPQTFGKLFAIPADGEVYTQPLYVSAVEVPGKGKRNIVYFATMNNSVYAHDADTGERIWCRNFGVPINAWEVQVCCTDISRTVGILGTPVIDRTTNRIYFVSRNKDNDGTFHQYLNALDIATGTPTAESPREITAQSAGITFDPKIQNQRPALTLANDNIYIAWASHNDGGPYHGWVMSYRASDLTQKNIYMDTPNGEMGGIWMSGQGLTVDNDGNVYFASGNGTWRADGSATGNSYVKLSPELRLLDWFTPFDSDGMNAVDADLGSCGLLGIPGTHYIVGGSKYGVLYLVDTNAMSHFHAGGDQIVQEFQGIFGTGTSHVHGTPIFYSSARHGTTLLVWGENDVLRAYSINTLAPRINTTPYATSRMKAPMTNAFGAMPGGIISFSSNNNIATSNIIWASTPYDANSNNAVVRGVLHAFNAETLQEIWSDKTNSPRDEIGRFAKFCPPTVANGKLFVPNFGPLGAPDGSGQLVVYGILPGNGVSVDCGGSATGSFVADTAFTGGTTGTLPASMTIDTSGIASPPPATIYRSWRIGSTAQGFQYTIPNLSPGTTYRLRLHFLEPEMNLPGKRRFNIRINNQTVIRGFDIFTAAGSRKNRAVLRQYTATATALGTINLSFDSVTDNPLVCGIEVASIGDVNYGDGFASSAGLTFNGSAKLNGIGPAAQVTDNGGGESGSIFTTRPVNINSFHARFSFQLVNPVADGFTFTIQGTGATALGNSGGGLGFEGIAKSVGLKFDLWNNAGEGNDSLGLYLNGATPTQPATELTQFGINLHSGHIFNVTLDYNGKTLAVSLQDMTTNARYKTSYTVNIPTTVGSTQAYVGFTGGTGGAGATQNILNWSMTGGLTP